jgi:hypothetical protein
VGEATGRSLVNVSQVSNPIKLNGVPGIVADFLGIESCHLSSVSTGFLLIPSSLAPFSSHSYA